MQLFLQSDWPRGSAGFTTMIKRFRLALLPKLKKGTTRMFRKLKPLAVLLIVSPLAACATHTAGIDSGCKSFRPITWSKGDTQPTQRQIVKHNAAFDAICKS
jgi:hypothetical protein